MKYLILLSALSLSLVAGYYSIVGLATIFAAAAIPVIIMGTVLEIGKLITTLFLHQNWSTLNWRLKYYLTSAVAVLMFITSMGIFGFLSKAHIEQTVNQGGNNTIQVANIERRIENQNRIIRDAELVVAQLDTQVETLIEYDRIRGPDGSIAVRQGQQEERGLLNDTINAAYGEIESLQTELLPLRRQQLSLEAEVGPIKYIAEMIYGQEANEDLLEEAVRWVILVIIFVFDPLAVALLLAWSTINKKEPEIKVVEKIVEKIVEKEVPVEKIVVKEVPVEKVVEKFIIKGQNVEREVEKTVEESPNYSDSTRKDQNKKNRLTTTKKEGPKSP